MDIKIYTIPGCHYCDKVKELFNIIGEQYSQVIIGRDLMKSEFDVEFPAAAGFPHVIIDGKEKVIICQEKFADNTLYIQDKVSDVYSYSAKIRSVSELSLIHI